MPLLPPLSIPIATDVDGVVRVGGTRVTLDTVVMAYTEGLSAEEIVRQYPSLDLADTHAAIAYYLRHRDEVDAYLAERRRLAASVRRENEARCDPDPATFGAEQEQTHRRAEAEQRNEQRRDGHIEGRRQGGLGRGHGLSPLCAPSRIQGRGLPTVGGPDHSPDPGACHDFLQGAKGPIRPDDPAQCERR